VSVEINAGLRCMRAGSRCEGKRTVHKVPALFGLRGSQTQVHGEDGKAGIGLVSQSAAYMTDRSAQITARSSHFAFLGGGRAGLEGGIGLSLGMGLYQPVAASHGPFSRLGGRGFLFGNAALYASMLELPTLELGYQLLERDLHLELSGHGGAVLTGRYKPGDERRKLGSAFSYGGLLAARLAAVDLELDLSRIEPGESDPNGPFDMLTLLLCGGARYFGVCFDARILDGGVPVRGGSRNVQSSFLGLSVGGLTQEPPREHH